MSAVDATDSAQGRRLADRYRLTHVLGSGGNGTVWAAVDEVLARQVAVKDVVAPPWLSDEERAALRERTLREAQAACRIDHPNVVTVYDVIEHDDRPWIIMQLVQAPSLADIIDQDGPCTPSRVADIGLQVLGALRAAHAHGILHRDVKPSNVLVEGGWAVLTDFGIATIPGAASLTAPDALVGAPSYIAPERVRGEPATPASDLWSLGATLYTAVEGRPPHLREGGALPILTAVATDEPDPPRRAGALAPLLDALLRKDPEERPSADEVEHALRRISLLASGLDDDTVLATASTSTVSDATQGLLPVAADTGDAADAADADATQVVDRADRADTAPKRRRPRAAVVAAAATLAVFALALGALLAREASVPGSPSRQPAGDLATTVPVSSGPAGPQPSGANQVAPVDGSTSTAVEPAAEPTPDAQPTTQPPPSQPGDPTPTATQEPTATTTPEVTTSPPTTSTTETTAAATSVLP